ncbi:MAG: hypothetical protein R3Y58_07435 [Eubacteriales bacterium]
MDWISKLERKYGKYAVSSIMKYIIILQVAGYFIMMMSPEFYYQYLCLDASAILRGQVWRMITFVMDPPTTSIIFLFFAFYVYYMIGESLERIWGAFRFNIYLLSGILFHVIGALLAFWITGLAYPLGTEYLYLSLFFAFTLSFPDTQFLLFFIIPIKAKYLGWLNGAFFAFTVLQGILPSYASSAVGIIYQANAIAAFVSILNFLIFYFSSRNFKKHSPKERMRKQKFKQEIKKARRPDNTYGNGAKHKCTVCGRTELDDPTLEFRYCSKCEGNHEYCQDHLFTHQHIQ